MIDICTLDKRTPNPCSRTEEIVHSVKCLLYEQKDLSSVPRLPHHKPDVIACTCNPGGTGEVVAGGSLAYPAFKLQVSERTCL